MRLHALIAALIAALLGPADAAVAAANWVPRMERQGACSWDRPGHNPFTGDVVAAIDRYSDIPTLVRIELKQRMQARQYDDLVEIRRDEISGRERYEPAIRDMHFGLDRVCRQVTRTRWTAQMHERGLVYCEQGHCILVPTVCRNVSRIERRPTLVAGAKIADPGDAALNFAAPAAGPVDGAAQALAAPSASRAPSISASFAEAVAGAVVPLWPDAGNAGSGIDIGAGWPPGFGPWPWWPSASAGGGSGPDGAIGGGADDGIGETVGGNPGSGGSDGSGSGGGTFPGGADSGAFPGGSAGGGNSGGGGGGGGDGGVPVAAVPEPSTWVSLLVGLLALAMVSARQRQRRRELPR